jgi:magnesium-transporting ATPase (P-type)
MNFLIIKLCSQVFVYLFIHVFIYYRSFSDSDGKQIRNERKSSFTYAYVLEVSLSRVVLTFAVWNRENHMVQNNAELPLYLRRL